ncbi:unnamed protein product [Musa textilis]
MISISSYGWFGLEEVYFHISGSLTTSFVETDGKGFDRVRRTETGKKHFKLTHFEEVFTTHHWIVRIYKLKPPKKSKSNSKANSTSKSKRNGNARKNPWR